MIYFMVILNCEHSPLRNDSKQICYNIYFRQKFIYPSIGLVTEKLSYREDTGGLYKSTVRGATLETWYMGAGCILLRHSFGTRTKRLM
jgi:hypothetical protein